MLFANKYPNAKYLDRVESGYFLVGHEEPCIVCGQLTKFIDINSEAHICSTECENSFIKILTVFESEHPMHEDKELI